MVGSRRRDFGVRDDWTRYLSALLVFLVAGVVGIGCSSDSGSRAPGSDDGGEVDERDVCEDAYGESDAAMDASDGVAKDTFADTESDGGPGADTDDVVATNTSEPSNGGLDTDSSDRRRSDSGDVSDGGDATVPSRETKCGDGKDNDRDGDTDCAEDIDCDGLSCGPDTTNVCCFKGPPPYTDGTCIEQREPCPK